MKRWKIYLQKKIFEKKIKEQFSDCVFIIDEVHNIKEGDDLKVLPPKLEKVFKMTENMKFFYSVLLQCMTHRKKLYF